MPTLGHVFVLRFAAQTYQKCGEFVRIFSQIHDKCLLACGEGRTGGFARKRGSGVFLLKCPWSPFFLSQAIRINAARLIRFPNSKPKSTIQPLINYFVQFGYFLDVQMY